MNIPQRNIPQRPDMKSWNGDTLVYAHGKLDGIMITYHEGRVYTRHPDPSKGDVTHRVANTGWFDAARRLEQTLMGELWMPDHPASAVKSDWEQARFSVFAMPGLKPDSPLEALQELCEVYNLNFAPFWTYAEIDEDMLGTPKQMHDQLEGFVFKDGNTLNWQKYKPTRTIDLVCTALVPGKGSRLGQWGSIKCRTTEGHVVCNTSGMTWHERRALSEKDLGRVCEIAYQYVGSQGRLRHPRFERWRDDKTPDQCSVTQDTELAEFWTKPTNIKTAVD